MKYVLFLLKMVSNMKEYLDLALGARTASPHEPFFSIPGNQSRKALVFILFLLCELIFNFVFLLIFSRFGLIDILCKFLVIPNLSG